MCLSVNNRDLQAFHDVQCLFVHEGIGAGGAACVYDDFCFGQCGFYQNRIAQYADVGYQTHQLYLFILLFFADFHQLQRAEGRLFNDDVTCAAGFCGLAVYIPALGIADAVDDGQLLAFLCLQVVLLVGVLGVNDVCVLFLVVLLYLCCNLFIQQLSTCKSEHKKLEKEISFHLNRFHDEGKQPNPMAKSMSWIKTNVKLMMHESDKTIADLMTDGCDMGVKSLSKYLNQYKAADERSKDIAKKLIKIEQRLGDDIRGYL